MDLEIPIYIVNIKSVLYEEYARRSFFQLLSDTSIRTKDFRKLTQLSILHLNETVKQNI